MVLKRELAAGSPLHMDHMTPGSPAGVTRRASLVVWEEGGCVHPPNKICTLLVTG